MGWMGINHGIRGQKSNKELRHPIGCMIPEYSTPGRGHGIGGRGRVGGSMKRSDGRAAGTSQDAGCDAGVSVKRPRPIHPPRAYWAQQPRHAPTPHMGPVVHCGCGIPRAPAAGTMSSSQTFWSQRVRSDVIITRHGDGVARCQPSTSRKKIAERCCTLPRAESMAHFARVCMGTKAKASTSTQRAPALYVHQTGGFCAGVCARESALSSWHRGAGNIKAEHVRCCAAALLQCGAESTVHFRTRTGTKASTSTQRAPALYVHQTAGLCAGVCARENALSSWHDRGATVAIEHFSACSSLQ